MEEMPKPKLRERRYTRFIPLDGGGSVRVPIIQWECDGGGVEVNEDTADKAYASWRLSYRHLQRLRASGKVP